MIEVKIIHIVVLGIACISFGFALCNFLWAFLNYRKALFKKKRQNRCDKR